MRYALPSVAAASLILLAGCDSSGSTTSSETAAAPAALHKIGETASADGLDVTVTSVKQTSSPYPGIDPAGADETYVVAHYTLKNTSGDALDLMDRPGVELADAAGHTYALDEIATAVGGAMADTSGAVSNMNPGTSIKTAAAWKVAKKGLDLATWKIVVHTDPELEFQLK